MVGRVIKTSEQTLLAQQVFLQALVLLATVKKLRKQAILWDDFLHILCIVVKKLSNLDH